MKKIDKFLVAMALMIIAIPLSKVAWRVYCEIKPLNTDHLSGKLLYSDPRANGETLLPDADHLIVDLKDMTRTPVKLVWENAIFFGSSSKILVLNCSEGGCVELVDANAGSCETVYEFNDETSYNDLSYMKITYVDENHFSIGREFEKTIILVDIDTKECTLVAEDVYPEHSWYNGEIIYYSREGEIFSLNIETGEEKYICGGLCPDVSADGKRLAYSSGDLRVRDLETDEVWRYGHRSYDFCISPDGEYVALLEEWRGFGIKKCQTLRVWGYKERSTYKVEPIFSGLWDMDWVE